MLLVTEGWNHGNPEEPWFLHRSEEPGKTFKAGGSNFIRYMWDFYTLKAESEALLAPDAVQIVTRGVPQG